MRLMRQRPVKGGRVPTAASVIPTLQAIVERTSRDFGVSKSFVIAVALAKAFHVPIETYEDRERPRRLRRVK